MSDEINESGDDGLTVRRGPGGLTDTDSPSPPTASEIPGLTELGLRDWMAIAHLDATAAIAVMTDAGLNHVATDGGVATLTSLGTRATVTPLTEHMVRVQLMPDDPTEDADGKWWFESTAEAAATELQQHDAELVELVGNRLLGAAVQYEPPITQAIPHGPPLGQPIPMTAPAVRPGAPPLSVVGVLCAAVIACMAIVGLYALVPNQVPESVAKGLLPIPMFAIPLEPLRNELIALAASAGITVALGLFRRPASRAFGILTAIGTLAAIVAGVMYFGSQSDWKLVPDLLAPRDLYGFYLVAAAALILTVTTVGARASTNAQATVAVGALAALGLVAAITYNASENSFSRLGLSANLSMSRNNVAASQSSSYNTSSYSSGYSSNTTPTRSSVPNVSSFGSAATCDGLIGSFRPIQFFRTTRFEITICQSGTGSYGYHGRAISDGSSIALPATFDGNEYTADNAGYHYVVDGTEIRVYQNGTLDTVEAVQNGTAPAQTSIDALQRLASLLVTSHDGRVMVLQLAADTGSTCSVSGSGAQSTIRSIITNREQMLQAAQSLQSQAPGSNAPVGLFVQAMQLSLDADRAWQRWIDRQWVPFANAGCSGPIQYGGDSDWDAYFSASHDAETTKAALVAQFNPLAAQAGLKSDWTEVDV